MAAEMRRENSGAAASAFTSRLTAPRDHSKNTLCISHQIEPHKGPITPHPPSPHWGTPAGVTQIKKGERNAGRFYIPIS